MIISSSEPQNLIVRGKIQDESVTSSTALQDDNHLTFPIKAGEMWAINAYLIAEYNTAGQIKVGINGPTANFVQIAANENCNGATPAYGTESSLNTGISLTVVGATAGIVEFVGAIAASADGTVAIQWAQAVSNGAATTVKAGSYLTAYRVS